MYEDLKNIDLNNLPFKTTIGDFTFIIAERPAPNINPFVIMKNKKLGLNKVISSPDVADEAGYACLIKLTYELFENRKDD